MIFVYILKYILKDICSIFKYDKYESVNNILP